MKDLETVLKTICQANSEFFNLLTEGEMKIEKDVLIFYCPVKNVLRRAESSIVDFSLLARLLNLETVSLRLEGMKNLDVKNWTVIEYDHLYRTVANPTSSN